MKENIYSLCVFLVFISSVLGTYEFTSYQPEDMINLDLVNKCIHFSMVYHKILFLITLDDLQEYQEFLQEHYNTEIIKHYNDIILILMLATIFYAICEWMYPKQNYFLVLNSYLIQIKGILNWREYYKRLEYYPHQSRLWMFKVWCLQSLCTLCFLLLSHLPFHLIRICKFLQLPQYVLFFLCFLSFNHGHIHQAIIDVYNVFLLSEML